MQCRASARARKARSRSVGIGWLTGLLVSAAQPAWSCAPRARMELLEHEHEYRAANQRARDQQAEQEFFGPVHNRARLVYFGPTPLIRRLVLCHLLNDVRWRIITPLCCITFRPAVVTLHATWTPTLA